MSNDDDILEAQSERGYSLYDLVVLADEGELDKIDSQTLLKQAPTSWPYFWNA
ncbi:MAG: hypothetical protein ACLUKN_03755 [Bacilli bacterium]